MNWLWLDQIELQKFHSIIVINKLHAVDVLLYGIHIVLGKTLLTKIASFLSNFFRDTENLVCIHSNDWNFGSFVQNIVKGSSTQCPETVGDIEGYAINA